MDLICYGLMGSKSRKALGRPYGKFGHRYKYRPRNALLERLSKELGWSKESVRQQLYRERAFLLEVKREFSNI